MSNPTKNKPHVFICVQYFSENSQKCPDIVRLYQGLVKTNEKWINDTTMKFKHQKHLKCDLPLETLWLSVSCLMVVHSPVQSPNLPDRLWPLLTILFGLLPLNQLKVRLRDESRFFLLLLVLFCMASISVMSLGTRSPVELLLDIFTCHLFQSCHLLRQSHWWKKKKRKKKNDL